MKELVIERQNAPVAIDRGADAMLLLARMVGGDQMLAPILDPFDRPRMRSAATQTSTSSG